MSKQFVISTNSGSVTLKNEITAFIKGKDWDFWHWFDNLWLIADVDDSYTAKQLHREIVALNPQAAILTVVIFDMNEKSSRGFFGRAPKKSWLWMSQNWGKPK